MCEQKTNVVELELEELALVNGGGQGDGYEPNVKVASLSVVSVSVLLPDEDNKGGGNV